MPPVTSGASSSILKQGDRCIVFVMFYCGLNRTLRTVKHSRRGRTQLMVYCSVPTAETFLLLNVRRICRGVLLDGVGSAQKDHKVREFFSAREMPVHCSILYSLPSLLIRDYNNSRSTVFGFVYFEELSATHRTWTCRLHSSTLVLGPRCV